LADKEPFDYIHKLIVNSKKTDTFGSIQERLQKTAIPLNCFNVAKPTIAQFDDFLEQRAKLILDRIIAVVGPELIVVHNSEDEDGDD
jgi:hypothetical protein